MAKIGRLVYELEREKITKAIIRKRAEISKLEWTLHFFEALEQGCTKTAARAIADRERKMGEAGAAHVTTAGDIGRLNHRVNDLEKASTPAADAKIKCPDCSEGELQQKSAPAEGKPGETAVWLECPVCFSKFESEDAVIEALDGKDAEMAAKHEEITPEPSTDDGDGGPEPGH